MRFPPAWRQVGIVVVLSAGAGGGVFWWLSHQAHSENSPASTVVAGSDNSPAVIHRTGQNELMLPLETIQKMGLQTVTAACPSQAIKLPSFQGVIALDSDRLSRIH